MEYRLFIQQFFITLGSLRAAFELIREKRLWEGIDRYGWVLRVLLVAAIIMGFYFMSEVWNWLQSLLQAHSVGDVINNMGLMASKTAQEGYASFSSGLMKYIVLLLSEVIIFHFMQRSLEEVQNKPIRTDFQAFLDAQIRMLKVVVRTWIMELIVTVLLAVVFGIFGFLAWLKPVALWLVQCYFLGLVILDNYNEQFGLPVKMSITFSRQLLGVALALGMVLYLCMLVPLIGVVAGTIWVSVTAVLAMQRLAIPIPVPPEAEADGETGS
jgi:hypothetical protein